MRRLEWSAHATADIQTIKAYWIIRDPELLVDLDRELRSAIDFLLDNPGAGSPVEGSKRKKWPIGRTPFLLFYSATAQVVRIWRIRHQHQNWRRSH